MKKVLFFEIFFWRLWFFFMGKGRSDFVASTFFAKKKLLNNVKQDSFTQKKKISKKDFFALAFLHA
jgi:hypothetical protein